MDKRIFISVVVLLVAIVASGQVQHGYVKTKGTASQPGSRLENATITVRNGNSVVSNGKGEFSFNVPGKNFSFSNVIKKGYVLIDNDFLRRNFVHSSEWKVIVMEKPEQRVKEMRIIEEKINKTLEAEVQKKEAEIAKLEKEGKKSASEIRKLKQMLYIAIEEKEKLVNEMAERFVSFDYDQMDDANRQVTEMILDGDLANAKKILDSQGNIEDKIVDVREKQENTSKAQKSVGDWCYNKYCIFNLENNIDSAAFYIKKRAEIDPANLSWQLDAATFFHRNGQEEIANDYYEKALHFARWQAADNAPEHIALLAITLNNLALLYQNSGKDNIESMHKEAATIFKKLVDSGELIYEPYLASTYNNLGIYFSNIEDGFEQSEKYYNLALQLYQNCSQDDIELKAKAGSIMNNLGNLYNDMGRFDDSESMYKESLELFRLLNKTLPNHYDREVASSLNGLSSLYQRNDVKESEIDSMTDEALSILRELVKKNRNLYPNLVSVLYNKANYCVKKNRNEDAEAYYNEAIELCHSMQSYNSITYSNLLFKLLTEQAMIDYRNEKFEKSEMLFREALKLCKNRDGISDSNSMANQALVLRHLAVLLDKRQQWQESEQMYIEELEINKLLAKQDSQTYASHLARNYGNMSSHALFMKNFTKAEEYALAGLEIDPEKLFIYSNLAIAKLFLGKYEEAKEIFEYYKTELASTFLDDLNQYASMGIIPPERSKDVENVIKILNE